ncbi:MULTISPECIES: ATP-binding protein [unclassified Caballeronia]|uniref:PAS domain-containing sensor histidine kinase n=1 Tax=unclassified Caballeronia TaxID=2646786 RepID=UPI0020290047|nr:MULTISPECIES: ATP-binding protein [unclassified Caballeronia]
MDQLIKTFGTAALPDPATLFALLVDAYVVMDINHRIVFVNQSYLHLTGQTEDALLGISIFEINQHGDAAQSAARVDCIESVLTDLKPGQTRSSVYFHADWPTESDGLVQRFWKLKASIIDLPADAGRYYVLRVSDVTSRVQEREVEQRDKARLRSQAQLRQIVAVEKEKQLRESREQLSEVLTFAKVGAWQRDIATGAVVCTDQCKLNMGIAVEEELSEKRLFAELIHRGDRRRIRAELIASIAEHRDYEVEYRVPGRAGTTRWVLAGGRARYDENGYPTHMLGFTLDISVRKEKELEQQRIAGSERAARERSEENARAMDHFLTAVSHELRSPIGVIINWTELLSRSGDKIGLSRATDTIQRNAKQLSLMVDDLLDSGAIVSGKLSIQFARVALDTLVSDVINDLRPQAEHKGLDVTCLQLEPSLVQGDAARLKQIVWNLVTNAIKFCDAGKIEVSVSHVGMQAIVTVRDTGCGIAPEAITTIFDRFEQIRPKSSGRVSGLGLGLWLVKTLVERHHGTIEVQSDGEGYGTTFLVSLPREA